MTLHLIEIDKKENPFCAQQQTEHKTTLIFNNYKMQPLKSKHAYHRYINTYTLQLQDTGQALYVFNQLLLKWQYAYI